MVLRFYCSDQLSVISLFHQTVSQAADRPVKIALIPTFLIAYVYVECQARTCFEVFLFGLGKIHVILSRRQKGSVYTGCDYNYIFSMSSDKWILAFDVDICHGHGQPLYVLFSKVTNISGQILPIFMSSSFSQELWCCEMFFHICRNGCWTGSSPCHSLILQEFPGMSRSAKALGLFSQASCICDLWVVGLLIFLLDFFLSR